MHVTFDLFNIVSDLTEVQRWIFGGITTLAISVAGIAFKYWLDRRDAKKSAFKKAIANFKTAFTDEVIQLEKPHTSNLDNSPRVIIEKAATKHKNAALELRRRLSKPEQAEFDAVWKEYEGENKYDGVHNVATAKRKLALERIKKLLEFADNLKP